MESIYIVHDMFATKVDELGEMAYEIKRTFGKPLGVFRPMSSFFYANPKRAFTPEEMTDLGELLVDIRAAYVEEANALIQSGFTKQWISNLPGIDSSHVIPSSPQLIKENRSK